MKIVLWIGNEANQKALACKIHAAFPISGIVTESRPHKRRITVAKVFEKIFERLLLPAIGKAWWGMKAHYDQQFPHYPAVKTIDVENINDPTALHFTKAINPDLIIVSGTRMIKGDALAIAPRRGILNLHTGLSPYIKGGPNCTNWCLATGQFHLIGNTVMWLDAGIDSGNIVTSEFTSFVGNEDLTSIHTKVMDHAHELYLKAIQYVSSGGEAGIPQSGIASGITYYTRQWKLPQKIKLTRNIKKMGVQIRSGEIARLRQGIQTVPLP